MIKLMRRPEIRGWCLSWKGGGRTWRIGLGSLVDWGFRESLRTAGCETFPWWHWSTFVFWMRYEVPGGVACQLRVLWFYMGCKWER